MFFYKVYEQNNKELVVFRVVKKQKRENKDGVNCIIEMAILSKNNKGLVVFRVVKQKKKL